MASSPSGQNFLRLLFGGAQRGVDRAFQQQDQSVNLATTLQQMMTRQQEFNQRTDLIESGQQQAQERFDQRLEYDKGQASAQGVRQRTQDYLDTKQQWVENIRKKQEFEVAKKSADAQIKATNALARYREGQTPGAQMFAQIAENLSTGFYMDILGRPRDVTPESETQFFQMLDSMATKFGVALTTSKGTPAAATLGPPAPPKTALDAKLEAEEEKYRQLGGDPDTIR